MSCPSRLRAPFPSRLRARSPHGCARRVPRGCTHRAPRGCAHHFLRGVARCAPRRVACRGPLGCARCAPRGCARRGPLGSARCGPLGSARRSSSSQSKRWRCLARATSHPTAYPVLTPGFLTTRHKTPGTRGTRDTPTVGASRGGDGSASSLSRGGSSGGVLCGARFGLHSHSHSHSHSHGGQSCLRMPTLRAFCGGDPGSPEPSRGGSGVGGGSWSLLHSALSALGSNASGLVVVASIAPLAGSTLAVPWVGAGAAFASDDALPGSCASTTVRSTFICRRSKTSPRLQVQG